MEIARLAFYLLSYIAARAEKQACYAASARSCRVRKRRWLAVALLTASAALPLATVFGTAGCTQHARYEHTFSPSPSGRLVASVLSTTTALAVPTEGIPLTESATLRIRRSDGGILMNLRLAGTVGEDGPSGGEIAWSGDEKYIACWVLGALWIIDVPARSKHQIEADEIGSIRWQSNSSLVFVENHWGWSETHPEQRVYSLSLPQFKRTLLLSAHAKLPFPRFVSAYCNQLSARAEFFIYYSEGLLRVASVKDGGLLAEFPIGDQPDYWWWNEGSNACLLSTGSMDRVWFYDRQEDSLKEITAQLQNMSGVELQTPHPPVVGRVWGPDGTWYLVSGIGKRKSGEGTEPKFAAKDWIYLVEDGSAICVQDEIGDDFWNPTLSPTGEFVAVTRRRGSSDQRGGLYVSEIRSDSKRDITLEQPRKVYDDHFTSWFWSPDGAKLFVSGRKGLLSIEKEQMK